MPPLLFDAFAPRADVFAEERDECFAPPVRPLPELRFAGDFDVPRLADFFDDEPLAFDAADLPADFEPRFVAALRLPALFDAALFFDALFVEAFFFDADFFDVLRLAALFFEAPLFDDFAEEAAELLRFDEVDEERFDPLFDAELRPAPALFDPPLLFREELFLALVPREEELTSTDLRSTSFEKRLLR